MKQKHAEQWTSEEKISRVLYDLIIIIIIISSSSSSTDSGSHKTCSRGRPNFRTSMCLTSGGANTVKEPGHFEVRESSSHITQSQGRSQDFLWGCTFSSKKLTTFFSCRPQNTGRQCRRLLHCQNKTNKAVRYGNIFIFCSYYYRSKAIGRTEPGQWIFQSGTSWCSAATMPDWLSLTTDC